MAAALAAGFRSVAILVDPRKADELHALNAEIDLWPPFSVDWAFDRPGRGACGSRSGRGRAGALRACPAGGDFAPVLRPGRRQARRCALRHRHPHQNRQAGSEIIELPASASGAIVVDREKCTLCMACVSACPAVRATTPKSPSFASSNRPAFSVASVPRPVPRTRFR